MRKFNAQYFPYLIKISKIHTKTAVFRENPNINAFTKVYASSSNVESKFEEERLRTDDLFYSNESIPISNISSQCETFPKVVLPQLPLVCNPQPIGQNVVAETSFSEIPVIGGPFWVEFCNVVYNLRGNLKVNNETCQLNWIYPNKFIFDKYGPIVRLNTPTRNDIILLSKPQHILTVQTNNCLQNTKCVLDSLGYCKQKTSQFFAPHYGQDFTAIAENYKNKLNYTADDFLLLFNKIALDFVNRVCALRDHKFEVQQDFSSILHCWSLKCFSNVMFGGNIEFKQTGLDNLVKTLKEVTKALRNCESFPQLWRLVSTSSTKSLLLCTEILKGLILRNVRITYLKLRRLTNEKEGEETLQSKALLASMILKEKMTEENIISILLDLLIIGVTTTANITGLVLYNLAKHPQIQERIFWEINHVSNNQNELSPKDIIHIPLIRACIAETVRLWPPFTHTVRETTEDISIYGYTIPTNTKVVMAHQIGFNKNEYFAEPRKFNPKRWIGRFSKQFDPLEVMPFCLRQDPIIKELTYRQIALVVANLVKKFEIQYNYGDIQYDHKILCACNKALLFTFKDR